MAAALLGSRPEAEEICSHHQGLCRLPRPVRSAADRALITSCHQWSPFSGMPLNMDASVQRGTLAVVSGYDLLLQVLHHTSLMSYCLHDHALQNVSLHF